MYRRFKEAVNDAYFIEENLDYLLNRYSETRNMYEIEVITKLADQSQVCEDKLFMAVLEFGFGALELEELNRFTRVMEREIDSFEKTA